VKYQGISTDYLYSGQNVFRWSWCPSHPPTSYPGWPVHNGEYVFSRHFGHRLKWSSLVCAIGLSYL